jgi:hypothetical protein
MLPLKWPNNQLCVQLFICLNQQSSTVENIESKITRDEDVITDSEWEKLADELDGVFRAFQSHSQFRRAVPQLFTLASTTLSAMSSKVVCTAASTTEGIQVPPHPFVFLLSQEEAKELVAQFSGTEELDALIRSVILLPSYDSFPQLNWLGQSLGNEA